MTPGVKTNSPPKDPKGSIKVQPQTGPGAAPSIVPVQDKKQSEKIEAVVQEEDGVGIRAEGAGEREPPPGEIPLAGPPKGVTNPGRHTGTFGSRGAPGGVQDGRRGGIILFNHYLYRLILSTNSAPPILPSFKTSKTIMPSVSDSSMIF